MAEAAGLVIGGVGLLGAFNTCLSAFDCVDAGKQYGRDYQRTAFKIHILQLRLSRWKQSVDIREDLTDINDRVQVASPDETETVRELLGRIQDDLETAEQKSRRYKLKQSPPLEADGTEAATIDALSSRMRELALRRQKGGTLGQKTRWALHDRNKFGHLVLELECNVTQLVELFPAIARQQAALAVGDVSDLVQSAATPTEETYAALHDAATTVDEQLVAAVEKVAAAQADGYVFEKMRMEGDAVGQFGTYYGPGQYQAGHRAKTRVNDFVAKGRTRTHVGDNVGGEYVLGSRFHQDLHGR